jgi:hypothetical protein
VATPAQGDTGAATGEIALMRRPACNVVQRMTTGSELRA